MHSLLIELSLTGSLLSPVTRGECHPGTDPSSCPVRKVTIEQTVIHDRTRATAFLPILRPHVKNAGERARRDGAFGPCGEPCLTRSSDHPVALSGD